MRKIFVFFILLCKTGFSLSQVAPLRGVVTIQNSLTSNGKVQPVVGATVKAGLATSTNTLDNGQFILKFILKEPGEDVTLDIYKKGLEVVNREKLNTQLRPVQQTGEYLSIYMCKKGEWEKNALKYYNINEAVITAEYKKQIQALKSKNLASAQTVAKLTKEKDYALRVAKEMAEKFAKANLDEATDLFTKAFQSFQIGNVKQAINVLNENRLQANHRLALKEIEEGKELIKIGEKKLVNGNTAIENIAADYVLKARLLIADLQFDSAEYAYVQAIRIDTNSIANLQEAADYIAFRNKFNNALELYGRVLMKHSSTQDSAIIYRKVGLIQLELKERKKSHESFATSLQLFSSLFKKDSVAFLPEMAASYENIAVSFFFNDSAQISLDYLKKAEDAYELLSKKDSIYNFALANILALQNRAYQLPDTSTHNLVLNTFNVILGENPLEKYDQIVSYLEKVVRKQVTGPAYSKMIEMLQSARNFSDTARILSADKQIQLLLAITKQVYGAALVNFLRNVEEQWKHRIMIGHNEKFTYKLAVKQLQESNVLLQKLGNENPQTFEPLIAQNLLLVSQSYLAAKDTLKAIQAAEKSSTLFKELASRNPAAYVSNLAISQNKLAEQYFISNQYQDALNTMKEALQNAKMCCTTDSTLHDILTYQISSRLNVLYEKYLKSFPAKLATEKQSAVANAELNNNLATKYTNRLTSDDIQTSDYYKFFFQTITADSLRELKEIDSLYDMASEYKSKGDELVDADKKKQAIDYYKRAASYYSTLVDTKNLKGGTLRYNLSDVYASLAYLSSASSDKALYQSKSVRILQELVERNPHLVGKLSEMKGNYSYYLILVRDYSEAIKQAKEALVLKEDNDWINTNLALGFLMNGEYGKAKEIYTTYKDNNYRNGEKSFKRAFLDDLNNLEKLGISSPDMQKIRELLGK